MLRCRSCGWHRITTGIPDEIKDLNEIKAACKRCGKPRQFRCPKCQNVIKMVRTVK